MIGFDVTKAAGGRHHSGLMRVSARLRQELGGAVTPVAWDTRRREFVRADSREPAAWRREDWLLTPELFSEEERPGFGEFVRARPCRLAVVFHDAIPLKFPFITWPQSVARHPGYLKLLAGFDRVWAISEESRRELTGFWAWQGVATAPPVEVLALGADFSGTARAPARATPPAGRAQLLCVGILEPRKNQEFLLRVCDELWAEGLAFALHLVGRENPHFGAPVRAKIRELQRRRPELHYHAAAGDAELEKLYADARAVALPTRAEGCGLPVLEALWRATPCVASDLAVIRENAAGGGCLLAAPEDATAWKTALRAVLADDGAWRRLSAEAAARPLPRWSETAAVLQRGLAD